MKYFGIVESWHINEFRSFKNIILWTDMSNERINWMKWLSEKRRKIKIKILDERNEEMYSRCIDFNLTLTNIYLVFYYFI